VFAKDKKEGKKDRKRLTRSAAGDTPRPWGSRLAEIGTVPPIDPENNPTAQSDGDPPDIDS
jgi:hypothetical protein